MAARSDPDILSLAAQAEARVQAGAAEKLRRRALRIRKRVVIEAYRRLFVEPATGGLKPDAELMIADLSRVAGMGIYDLDPIPESTLRDHAARRNMVIHILDHIDLGGAALTDLARKIGESE